MDTGTSQSLRHHMSIAPDNDVFTYDFQYKAE